MPFSLRILILADYKSGKFLLQQFIDCFRLSDQTSNHSVAQNAESRSTTAIFHMIGNYLLLNLALLYYGRDPIRVIMPYAAELT